MWNDSFRFSSNAFALSFPVLQTHDSRAVLRFSLSSWRPLSPNLSASRRALLRACQDFARDFSFSARKKKRNGQHFDFIVIGTFFFFHERTYRVCATYYKLAKTIAFFPQCASWRSPITLSRCSLSFFFLFFLAREKFRRCLNNSAYKRTIIIRRYSRYDDPRIDKILRIAWHKLNRITFCFI